MTGPSGRTGPEVVALAIARAIEDPATPLRVPVGQDAEMILGLRRSLDDSSIRRGNEKGHWVYVVMRCKPDCSPLWTRSGVGGK